MNVPCLQQLAEHNTTQKNMHRHHHNNNPSVRVVDRGDRFVWVIDGDVLHRDGDLPAVVHHDGTQEWYMYGLRHRDKGQPAYIGADGTRAWFRAGSYHRPDGLPAITYADGRCVYVTNNYDDADDNTTTSWWLGCLAFMALLFTALVVGRSAVLAVLSAMYEE